MDQNLSLYHIFNTVALTGNISHAAKQLYISQPAVSKAISSLEENIAMTLFKRSSKGVALTEEGRMLYEHTKIAFDTLQRGEDQLKRVRDLGIGQLRIGASTTLCKHLLLPYLNGFVKKYPHIKITIENQSSYHTLKKLEQGTLDIGLVAKPDSDKTFHFISLGEIEDIFVATNTYLDNLKLRERSYDIFSSATLMLLDEENVSRKLVDEYFNNNHIVPNHILEVSNMDLLIEFAKTSLGVACVIKKFVISELQKGNLIEIPLDTPLQEREVGFSYGKNAFLSESMLKFIDFITMIKG